MEIFLLIFSIIIAIISAWAQVKGGEHVVETFKSFAQKMVDLQIIPKTKVQELTDFISLRYTNFLNKVKSNKLLLLGFFYGILVSLLVLSLIALVIYIKINGLEETLGQLQLNVEKQPLKPSPYGGVNIIYLLLIFVLQFSIIGAKRGWAKELLVVFSVITALTINLILDKYMPFIKELDKATTSVFWIRTIILFTLIYFGYETVNVYRFATKATRVQLQDSLFGSVLGGVNGYLIVGSILYYLDFAGYPYPEVVAPATDPMFLQKIDRLMSVLPPEFLGEPGIYFALIILLIFILVVYV